MVINHADPGSSVTLRSSVDALKEHAKAEIPGLAENQFVKKIVYNGYTKGERNLGVNVHLETGVISPTLHAKLSPDDFDAAGRAMVSNKTVLSTSESEIVSGAKSALASSVMQMRADTNDLQRRLGDVRLNSDNQGVWGKYIGGKSKITDSAYVNQNYNMAQIGYDTKRGNWIVGGAFLYGTNNSDYALGSGSW